VLSKTDPLVLLIGGSSGTGKTILARQLGLGLGIPWLQADDLRLALQRIQVTLPKDTEDLYFFAETPHVWSLSPEYLCDKMIAAGGVLSPALEAIIEHHVDTSTPLIIEGDTILPSLFTRPAIQKRATNGAVRAIFVIEPDETILFNNIVTRGRGTVGQSVAELRVESQTKTLFGQWITREAHRYRLPVVESRPWSTLDRRVITAVRT
jgi:2-phosphoglycerate kinase